MRLRCDASELKLISVRTGVEPALWTFFFLISCLCTFLLLGLFVAVVTGITSSDRAALC